jgi:hypothetical protein
MASIQQYYQIFFLLLSYYFLIYKFSIKNTLLYQISLFLGVWIGGGGLVFYIPAVIYLFFKKRFKEAIFTVILFLINVYIYFIFFNYHFITVDSFSYVSEHFFDIAIYFLNFIGNIKIFTRYEYLVGLIFLLCSIFIAFKKQLEFQILILMAVIFTAFFTAVDRVHFGIWQALSSRYTMYPIILFSSGYLSILPYKDKGSSNNYIFIFALVFSLIIFSIAMPNGIRNLIKYDSDLKSKCIYYFSDKEHAINIYKESHKLGIYNLSCYK